MTEINKIILKLISEDKSIKEISKTLGISEKQLFIRIKQILSYGYNLKPVYHYNSDIFYKINKSNENEDEDQIYINIPNTQKEFRCIALSDMHIGNEASNMDLMKRVYDYAANNNINIIFNCGDILEGVHTTDKRNIENIYKQIEYLIKKHPYDKNINNFVILGNHDYHSLHYDGLDLSKSIKNSRYDIIPIGYGQGIVNIKDDKLALSHELSVVDMPSLDYDTKLVLVGHGHMMKTKIYDKLLLCLPSLSYVSPDRTKDIIPGFVDLTLNFNKNKFEFIKAKQMVITPKIIMASETRCRVKKINNQNQYDKGKK